MDAPLAENGVQEAVAQAAAFLGAVVVAADAEAGHQRRVGDGPVIAVVSAPLLVAADFDREAVDVDRRAAHAAVGTGGANPAIEPVGQRAAKFLTMGTLRQHVDQPRLRGLAAETLLGRLLAQAVPDRQLEGRVVRQAVQVVLRRVAQRQGVHALAEEFQQRVADPFRLPRIVQAGRQRLAQSQPMIGLAEQHRPAVASQPIAPRRNLDGPLKRRLQ